MLSFRHVLRQGVVGLRSARNAVTCVAEWFGRFAVFVGFNRCWHVGAPCSVVLCCLDRTETGNRSSCRLPAWWLVDSRGNAYAAVRRGKGGASASAV